MAFVIVSIEMIDLAEVNRTIIVNHLTIITVIYAKDWVHQHKTILLGGEKENII